MVEITRADAAALIAQEYAPEILGSAAQSSVALSAFPTVNMGTKVRNIAVLATLPEAKFLTGEGSEPGAKKSTTKQAWGNLQLVAEEIACIVPVSESTLADADHDILKDVAGLIGQSIGVTLDQAIMFGTSKPGSWTSPALLPAAVAASQTITNVEGGANHDDLWGAINQAAAALAAAGCVPSTALLDLTFRYRLANIRDVGGRPVFTDNSLAGFGTYFATNGSWEPASAEALIVDRDRVRIGVRQDVTTKLLDQATITLGGELVSLAEHDMVAIRAVARYAYVLGLGATARGANKTPVAAILPPGSVDPDE